MLIFITSEVRFGFFSSDVFRLEQYEIFLSCHKQFLVLLLLLTVRNIVRNLNLSTKLAKNTLALCKLSHSIKINQYEVHQKLSTLLYIVCDVQKIYFVKLEI
jgi:hypothetical protein